MCSGECYVTCHKDEDCQTSNDESCENIVGSPIGICISSTPSRITDYQNMYNGFCAHDGNDYCITHLSDSSAKVKGVDYVSCLLMDAVHTKVLLAFKRG